THEFALSFVCFLPELCFFSEQRQAAAIPKRQQAAALHNPALCALCPEPATHFSEPKTEHATIHAGSASETRHAFVPKTPEVFSYDADGNLTQDGRWVYVWNGENRLVRMVTRSDVPGPRYLLIFDYDWMGRRIRKFAYDLERRQIVGNTIFLYDGWNLIAEADAVTGELIRTYVWGLDLSGTEQGAGGIGGLLWITHHASRITHQVSFPVYDGNGNVMGLVSADDGAVVAQYEYGPFAEPLRAAGPLAAENPFRFSTKYTDPETGLLYYGYRYYSPSLGRWLSRDPVGISYALVGYNTAVLPVHFDDGCPYRWVNNQANLFVDPDGLRPQVPEPVKRLVKKLSSCLVQCQYGILFKKIDHWISTKYFCGRLRRYCQGDADITRSHVLPGDYTDVGNVGELQNAIGDVTAFTSCLVECLDISGRLSIKPYAKYKGGWKAWCDHRQARVVYQFRVEVVLDIRVSSVVGDHYEKRVNIRPRPVQGQCKIAYRDCCCG
ncbi:MAG: hypothetical protein H5T92_04775, partial [Synergistales bacterium]|nr:hypothetical protein [Synergistales bacterium]